MNSNEGIDAYFEHERQQQQLLDTEGLIRSAIQRKMGFPFGITITHTKITIIDYETLNRTFVMLKDGQLDEGVIKRLVLACLRLQKKHNKGAK